MSYYQTIYTRLRQHGLTEAGALGMLGNWDCESNCEPGRVQGDFSPYRNNSKAYVSGITAGSITREQFGRDAKGFGLAQWTYYSRKYQLYDFWKSSGKALDDPEMQTDFALKELAEGYGSLLNMLKTSNDLYTCTKLICTQFERPEVNNIDARFAAVQRIKAQIDLTGSAQQKPAEKSKKVKQTQPAEDHTWKPRTLSQSNAYNSDCVVLQALLNVHHFPCGSADGFYGPKTMAAVNAAQKFYGIEVDGVCGKQTWTKLLSYGK